MNHRLAPSRLRDDAPALSLILPLIQSVALGLMPHRAWADCSVGLPARIDLLPAGYRPTDRDARIIPIEVRIDGDCSYALGAEIAPADEHALSGPGGALPLTISLSSPAVRPLRNLPVSPLTDLLTGSTADGRSAATLWAVIPAGMNVAPGNYGGVVNFSLHALRDSPTAAYIPVASRAVQFNVGVLAYVHARLVIDGVASEFGAPRRLDFGELVTGARREYTVDIDSNTRYTLSSLSANSAFLVNRDHTGRTGDLAKIAYSHTPTAFVDRASGRSVTFAVQIGKVDDAPPGNYSDQIQLTVTAR